MPDPFDIFSGGGGGVGRNLLAPRVPTVLNPYGDIAGDPFRHRRFNPIEPFMPSAGEIQESVNEQEDVNKRGLFWDILALPEKVFFGQAIKGGIRGFGEGGIGGALEGFARGSPFAFLADTLFGTDLSRETQAADIRRAFGDTSEQTGAANFALNLAMDIALDPITFMLNPFGKTGVGLAKAGRGVAELAEATLAAKAAGAAGLGPAASAAILREFQVSAEIAKAVDVGDRAAIVLKIPFAKTPFFESNLGFKSLATNIGASMDRTMSALRTGPLGGLMRKFSVNMPAIEGAEGAASVIEAQAARDAMRESVATWFTTQLTTRAGKDSVDFVLGLQSSAPKREAIASMLELGADVFDERGAIHWMLDHPDVIMRQNRLKIRLKTDPKFEAVYKKAVSWDGVDPNGRAALEYVYRKYDDVPLPPQVLELAGLPQRYGAELSRFDEPLTQQKVVEAVGEQSGRLSAGTIRRGEAASEMAFGAEPTAERVLEQARARVHEGLDELLALDPNDKEKLANWMRVRNELMSELAKREAVAGLMNETFELAQGPYLYRFMSPETRKILNQQVRSKLSSWGEAGLNAQERFMQGREFTDMLTFEANALAEFVGIKATGYAPLADLRKLYEKHGPQAIWGEIYDRPFIRRLRGMGEHEAADFLSTNAVHNDYERVLASGRALSSRAYFDTIFKSPMVMDAAPASDVEKIGRLLSNQEYELVVQSGEVGRRIGQPGRAAMIEQNVSTEAAAAYEVTHWNIGQDLERRLASEGARANVEVRFLERALDVNPKLSKEALAFAQDEPASMVHMKRAAQEVQRAKDDLAAAKAARKSARGTQTQLTYEEAQAAYKAAQRDYDMVREAVRDHLDDAREVHRSIVGSMTGQARDAKQLLAAMKARGITPAMMDDQVRLTWKMQRDGFSAVREAQSTMLPDGSNLFDKIKQADPNATVYAFRRDDWNGIVKHFKEMSAPDPWRENPIARALDWVKMRWAPYTVLNPLWVNTQTRNVLTGEIMLGVGGLWKASEAARAVRIRKAFSDTINGKGTYSQILGTRTISYPGIGETTEAALLDRAIQLGVVRASTMSRDEIASSTFEAAAFHGTPPLKELAKDVASLLVPHKPLEKSAVLKLGMGWQAFQDDAVRLHGFLSALKDGHTYETAAEQVAKWTYDSSRNLTAFERHTLRRAIPFYSFAKWALGKTVDAYLEKPGITATLQKIRDTAYVSPPFGGQSIDPAQMDTILPQFLKDAIGIPYKNTPEGPRFFMFGSYLPIGELNQLVAGIEGMFDPNSTNGMLAYIGQKLHPALKIPVEFAVNRDLFTDRNIEKFPDEHREFMGLTLTGHQYQIARNVRLLSELDRLKVFSREQVTEIAKAAGHVNPLGAREELPFLERVGGSAFGFLPKTYQIDVQQDSRFQRMRAELDINRTKGLLRRRLIEREGKPAANADIEALRETMADQMADQAMRSALLQQYGVNAKEQEKAIKRNDRMALLLLRQKAGE